MPVTVCKFESCSGHQRLTILSKFLNVCPGGEMVDTLVSGTSVSDDVKVRVLSWAHNSRCIFASAVFYFEPITDNRLY